MKNIYLILSILLLVFGAQGLKAQNKSDSIRAKASNESDRNVMLNASSNVGPREVNIGLPASVGGTTILQNGMPVCFHFWPELPTSAWRQDATLTKFGLKSITETAIDAGVIGYSVTSEDNRGTDKFHIRGSINSNHFGLLNGSASISGPLGNGFKYVLGAYINLDPGTFDPKGYTKYYADNTKLYKVGLTKDYKTRNGKGSLTLFYRYANHKGMLSFTAPYYYDKGGKVREYNGFKIGNDSYLQNTGTMYMQDAYTGNIEERNPIDDYGTTSNAFDLLWDHQFNNGLKLKWDTRYRSAKSGINSTIMSNVASAGNNYTYMDGTPYTGEYVQNSMYMATRKTPIKTFLTTFEASKQSGQHFWTLGLNEWNYSAKDYTTEVVGFTQEVNDNPSLLLPVGSNTANYVNGMHGFNSFMEYHNGSMNKLALIAKDKWDISNLITVNLGARLEYLALRGQYIKVGDRSNGMLDKSKLSPIKNDWLNKNATANILYKITRKIGAVGDFMYAEQGGILGNYNTGADKEIKQSQINLASIGAYFNDRIINVVSKLSFIKRTNYSGNTNFIHPTTGLVSRTVIGYDVKTFGWTTDFIFKPVKMFNLHFLITLQDPQYSNYKGMLNFSDGTTRDYDFEGKSVTGISKVLLEIDPSFNYKKFRLWASARYFSKQYANLANTLSFEGHWETFAGANYMLNKNINFHVNVTNVLNQRGASGTISGTDLMTPEEAESREGTVMTGSYILPFTVKFGVNFNF